MVNRKKKRSFSKLRELILRSILNEQKTINQIASETGINWRTVNNHITYLIGKGFVKEVFSSKYVRIVEITAEGIAALQKIEIKPKQIFEKRGEVKIC